jgi:hypothetical protein
MYNSKLISNKKRYWYYLLKNILIIKREFVLTIILSNIKFKLLKKPISFYIIKKIQRALHSQDQISFNFQFSF